MKRILTILFLLATYISNGQLYNNFAVGRITDTATTPGSLMIPKYVRFPSYGSSDTNKVLGVDASGKITLRTKGSAGVTQTTLNDTSTAIHQWVWDNFSGGSGADSSIFATVYDVDTGKRNIRIQKQDVLSGTGVPNVSGGTISYLDPIYDIGLPYTLVERDGGGSIVANNIYLRSTSTVSAGGTTNMSSSSARTQVLTGSTSQTYKMPNATTLLTNAVWEFNNNSTGNLYIVDNGSNALFTFPAGSYVRLSCLSNATANGVWEAHYLLPHSIQAGDAGLNFSTSSAITGSVDWQGNAISAGYIDTFGISTRAWRQKGIDSVNINVSSKFNTADTTGKWLAAGTQFFKYSDTFNNVSTRSWRQKAVDSLNILIAAKGSGSVTSVATGYGLSGGTITTSGTLSVDTASMATRARVQKAVDSLNTTIATKGSGTVTSVSAGYGTTFSAITSSGSVVVDTVAMSTHGWRQKGVDSLNVQDALRVKYTDTSGMLAPYLRTVNALTASSTATLTNKRWTARVTSTTTVSATPSINTDNQDIWKVTAQAVDITNMSTNLTGTPVDGDILEIQITGTAARAITWGTSFVSSTVTLPTTTTSTSTLTVILQYYTNSSYGNNKWVCVNYF